VGRVPAAGGGGSGERAVSLRSRQPSTAALYTSSWLARARQVLNASSACSLIGCTCCFTAALNCWASAADTPAGTGVASTASASDCSDRPSFQREATAHSELPIDAAWLYTPCSCWSAATFWSIWSAGMALKFR
jgi:hypothetical protein